MRQNIIATLEDTDRTLQLAQKNAASGFARSNCRRFSFLKRVFVRRCKRPNS